VDSERLLAAVKAALAGGPPYAPDAASSALGVGSAARWPQGAAAILPTSGSTGRPRWVALGAAAVRACAEASAEALGGTGAWLLALPADRIAGVNVLARAALAGSALVALAPGPFTAEAFAAGAARLPAGPKYTSLVPTQLGRVLAGPAEARLALAGFDAVLVGGAALDPALRARAEAAGARLVETYGMTETCGGCVYDGLPLPGVEIGLAAGIIQRGGPTLALGYLDLAARAAPGGRPGGDGPPGPSRRAPKERPQPAVGLAEPAPQACPPTAPGAPGLRAGAAGRGFFEWGGRRWFGSSDVGAWTPSGALRVVGRADFAITTGGRTVRPEPVEAALLELEGVAQALVVGLPEAEWGELVTALVVPAEGGGPAAGHLRARLKARLGAAAAPRRLGLVARLPLAASGKPDRAAGRQLAARLAAAGQLQELS
jgi:O-succinylbenzoic acid--CoA ligase